MPDDHAAVILKHEPMQADGRMRGSNQEVTISGHGEINTRLGVRGEEPKRIADDPRRTMRRQRN